METVTCEVGPVGVIPVMFGGIVATAAGGPTFVGALPDPPPPTASGENHRERSESSKGA